MLQHLGFWMISFLVLLRYFTQSSEFSFIDILYTLLFHVSLVVTIYAHLRVLIPIFLEQKRYWVYALLLGLMLLLGIWLNMLIFDRLADFIFPGYYFVSQYEFHELLLFFLVYFVLTSLLSFSRAWFKQVQSDQLIMQLEREKLDAELTALKNQINPHFLFNTLNNLYSLALDQDNRVPDIILKLSESMRYVLYESKDTFVPLVNELRYVQHYIDLQKIRIQDQAQVQFEVEGDPQNLKIAPMLFLTLVENAFKHGIHGVIKGAFIHILVRISERRLMFQLKNARSLRGSNEDRGTSVDGGGIGLSNTKKRVALLYPGCHIWKQEETPEMYKISLTLDLIQDAHSLLNH